MKELKVDGVVRENDFEINFCDYFNKNKDFTETLKVKHKITHKGDANNFIRFLRSFGTLELPMEIGDRYYITSIWDNVIAYFMIELSILGFNNKKIKKYKDELLKDDFANKLLEYYIVQTALKKEVNFYVSSSSVQIMNINEFLINKTLGRFNLAYITISLNEIMGRISGADKHFVGETYFPGLDKDIEDHVFAMLEDEKIKCAVDEIINDKNYQSITLDKNGEKLDLIRKMKSYPLDAKLVDIKKQFPHSRAVIDNFGGDSVKILVEEKLKLDELVEKKKQLKNEKKKLPSK